MKLVALLVLALSGCSNAWAGKCCDRPVAMLGHSILAGTQVNVASRPHVVYENATNRATPDFLAVSGSTVGGCVTRWATRVSGGSYSAVIWQCAINSLGGGAVSSVIASSTGVWDAALAQGLRLVINLEMPCAGYGGCDAAFNTEITTYNAAATAYCAAHASVATCVDLYTQLGTGTALNALYDGGDHLHPNAVGSALIGSLDAAALP